jgi:hypothetical protein
MSCASRLINNANPSRTQRRARANFWNGSQKNVGLARIDTFTEEQAQMLQSSTAKSLPSTFYPLPKAAS